MKGTILTKAQVESVTREPPTRRHSDSSRRKLQFQTIWQKVDIGKKALCGPRLKKAAAIIMTNSYVDSKNMIMFRLF